VTAVRALPWGRVLAIARIVLERVGDDIPRKDRQRLTVLLRKSKGDPRKLTVNERHEIFTIIRKVDVVRLGRDVASVAALSRTAKLLKK
jgi:hypothetical protein